MVTINIDKLSQVIEAYKKYFPTKIKDEIYKWKAVKQFQDNWHIDMDIFAPMVKRALSKTENLLTSANSFPHKMILKFAEDNSTKVRNMFRNLFDESQDLSKRFNDFISAADAIKNEWDPSKAHYQNTNSISTYLWLKYPGKYYIYKYSEVVKATAVLQASFKPKKGYISSVISAYEMFDIIAEYISHDQELRDMLDNVLTPDCDIDKNLHTMVVDICFFISRYYKEAGDEVASIESSENNQVKYWLCAVGENGHKWEECYNSGVVRLGWDPVGELNQFATKEDIVKRLQEVYNRKESFVNDSLALWEFAHEMKIGDIIYAKKGRSTIIGKGIVESDYYYVPELGTYMNVRKVRWTDNGEWTCSSPFAMKTLTEFTHYPEFIKEIEDLISGGVQTESDEATDHSTASETSCKYWWLNASPKIWKMSEWKVGEEQDYTLFSENGGRRRVFQNFLDAQEGQVVICYETNPVKKITTIATVSKASDGEKIYFRKTRTLSDPVDLATIKSIPALENLEFLSNSRGTFFKVTDEEYEVIMDLIRQNNDDELESLNSPTYTKTDFLNEVFMEEEVYDELVELLKTKKNIILQGAPGVGKTFCAERLAYSIMGKRDDRRIKTVQFHQSYSYEDFIMGYKPDGDKFKLKNGLFYNFCIEATNNPSEDYFFIIDEINRGNLSKIFGELLMMIEKDYRGKEVSLAYSDQGFHVPENVYIIGMMNTADRSLALIDYALRRRFSFFDMKPGFNSPGFKAHIKATNNLKLVNIITLIAELNSDISKDDSLGAGFEIGHSYFCGKPEAITDSFIKRVIKYDIIPTIQEYWFDNEKKATEWSNRLMGAIND